MMNRKHDTSSFGDFDLSECVDSFEVARRRNPNVDLSSFLPPLTSDVRLQILCELVRVDLEYSISNGSKCNLDDYKTRFPDLFANSELRERVVFEDYRLRFLKGVAPSREWYAKTYDVQVDFWPDLVIEEEESVSAREFRDSFARSNEPELVGAQYSTSSQSADTFDSVVSWNDRPPVGHETIPLSPEMIAEIQQHNTPIQSSEPEKQQSTFPRNGTEIAGFELVSELGRGAFARVYLSRQRELADRLVVLKASSVFPGEIQTLAKLQHTNIVPIYSVHKHENLHLICMPYLGGTTLEHVLKNVRSQGMLPRSGRGLLSTICDREKSTRSLTESSKAGSSAKFPNQDLPSILGPLKSTSLDVQPNVSEANLANIERLSGMTYEDAVSWLFMRLADGLSHAHDRGILHRDLKPANILLSDDGEPMLLDFNLAKDLGSENALCGMGGTLHYMAPEHLNAFSDPTLRVDGRADIYGLGLIAYELLTGNHPFLAPKSTDYDSIKTLAKERKSLVEAPRFKNKNISPALSAIVEKSLEPSPAKRYPNALMLKEDLDRHLNNLPLKHAREPWSTERVRKWARRHPKLSSATSVGVMSVVVVALMASALMFAKDQLETYRAKQRFEEFQTANWEAQFYLDVGNQSPAHIEKGLNVATTELDRYGVLSDANWKEKIDVRKLATAEREKLNADLGELLLLASWGKILQADRSRENPAMFASLLEQANQFLDSAKRNFVQNSPAPQVLKIQAELKRRDNKPQEAQELERAAQQVKPSSARDKFLAARQHFQACEFLKAIEMLESATAESPDNFRYWFLLGRCYSNVGRDVDAYTAYTVCVVLRPDYEYSYVNRGLAGIRTRRHLRSIADFTKAIELKPNLVGAYINRGLARQELGDLQGSIADFDAALAKGEKQTRIYFMRAHAKELSGDKTGALADRQEGLKQTPTDEISWIALGNELTETEPQKALHAYEQALRINPRSLDAMQNSAYVFSEKLGKIEESLKVLNQELAYFPNYAYARIGRAVIHARMGNRKEAIADVDAALVLDQGGETLYQAACTYSLTSKSAPNDKAKAIELLANALRAGYGHAHLKTDPDLAPIRDDSQFVRLAQLSQPPKLQAQANN